MVAQCNAASVDSRTLASRSSREQDSDLCGLRVPSDGLKTAHRKVLANFTRAGVSRMSLPEEPHSYMNYE